MVKVKICGLSRECDIEAVNAAEPDYIGFVFAKSCRQVTPGQAMALRKILRPGIVPVGVFVNESPEIILSLVRTGVIEAVQLHGNENGEYIAKIKELTNVPVIKAIAVVMQGDVQSRQNTGADYLLLDRPGGGTGLAFDWGLIGKTDKPFFLAGGLNTENIRDAVDKVKPYAVDISSGVETDGFKDLHKIINIVGRLRNE